MPDEAKTGQDPVAVSKQAGSSNEREQPTPPTPAAPVPPSAQSSSAVEASKPAPPAAGAAKPAAAPAKPAGPQPTPWQSDMVTRFKARFGSGLREASTYAGQNYLVVDATIAFEVLQIMHDDEQFDYCADITAVHYPKRVGQELEVVWILYSFPRNERVRVKTAIAEGGSVISAVSVWAGTNWLERECFDMFGIRFEGHPDLKRILLPDDWTGHPLRKEYNLQQQDQGWVQANVGIESGQ